MDPQPVAPTPPPDQLQPASPPSPPKLPSEPKFDPSDIYPTPTATTNAVQPPIISQKNKSEDSGSMAFATGYSLGGGIFWRQLIFAILGGITMAVIFNSLTHNYSQSRSLVVSGVQLLFVAVVFLYVPYRYLKSHGVSMPGWLVALATCLEVIISQTVSTILTIWVLTGVSGTFGAFDWLTRKLSGGTILIAWLGLIVVLFVLAYFYTKLIYGIATAIFGRINQVRKLRFLTIAAVVAAVLIYALCAFGIHKYSEHRYNQLINSQQGVKSANLVRTTYDNNTGQKFDLLFYQNSTAKPISSAANSMHELVAPTYKLGKAPLTLFITSSPLSASSQNNYQQLRDCAAGSIAVSAYNPYLKQLLTACSIKDPQHPSYTLLYIAVGETQSEDYVITFGQDVDWAKAFSSTTDTKAVLASNGLGVYNSDISQILASINPL